MNPRRMGPEDIGEVVRVHLGAFPNFFLSFLGASFLREFYRGVLEDPSGIVLVAANGGRIIGFVAGTDQPAGFFSRLIRHRAWRFVLASLGAILHRPGVIPRLWRALRMPKQAATYGQAALLMSIGVAPGTQGGGAGKVLVEAFLKEASQRGIERVVLTTDRHNNDAVNAFYRNIGFSCSRHFVTPEGREMNEYEIAIHDRELKTL